MFQRNALTGLVLSFVFVVLMAHAAFADQIPIQFYLTGSPDYFTSCKGGNCFAVEYNDPGSQDIFPILGDPYGIGFGSFTAELTGTGGRQIDQPFTLTVNQTMPDPDGGTYAFSSQFTGRLTNNSNSNTLTVEFYTYSQTITGEGYSVLYEIAPASQLMNFPLGAGETTVTRYIDGVITASLIARPLSASIIPEPTSLLLLGTGLSALGLIAYRRRRK